MPKLRHFALTAQLLIALLAAAPAFATNYCQHKSDFVGPNAQTIALNACKADDTVYPPLNSCTSFTSAPTNNCGSSIVGNGTSTPDKFVIYIHGDSGVPTAPDITYYWFAANSNTANLAPCPTSGEVADATTSKCQAAPPTPSTAPSDSDCSSYSGKNYHRFTSWGNPVAVIDCSPSGCGLGTPSVTYGTSIIDYSYAYTGQNCASHGKTPTDVPDLTAPKQTEVKDDSTITTTDTRIDPNTGQTVTTTTTHSTTTTQGGGTQSIVDAIGDLGTALGGGGTGASASDIGDAVGDALKDPDEDTKPDVADYTGDAEGIIGGTEDQMDEYTSGVDGGGIGDGTDDPGFASAVGGLIPSYSCSDYTMSIPMTGESVSITCGDTSLWRSILGFFFYGATVVGLFMFLTERPMGG